MFASGLSFRFAKRFALYWAVQARLLTPLTFARHRFSPLELSIIIVSTGSGNMLHFT